MFLVFAVVAHLALALAPSQAADLTIEVRGQVFKAVACGGDWWCVEGLDDKVAFAPYDGGLWVRTRNGVDTFETAPFVTIPAEPASVDRVATDSPGVSLHVVREGLQIQLLRDDGVEVRPYASIRFGQAGSDAAKFNGGPQ